MEKKYRFWDEKRKEMVYSLLEMYKRYDEELDYFLKNALWFTGVKDINGFDIYEDDILYSHVSDSYQPVNFDDGCFYVGFRMLNEALIKQMNVKWAGDKYHTPELLNQERAKAAAKQRTTNAVCNLRTNCKHANTLHTISF